MFSFKPRPFVQSSFDTYIYICRRPDSHTCFFIFFPFCLFGEDVVFSDFFVLFPLFSLCMERTSYVLSFRVMVLFYPVTTGWIFDINQLIM